MTHASTTCTELTAKQLGLLQAAENLEWTCHECAAKSPKRSSFVVPDYGEDDDDDDLQGDGAIYPIDTKKLVADITKHMDKVFKRDLKELQQAVQFTSDKMDDCLESIEAFKEKIKELDKKNTDLVNRNKHLERRLEAQEQRLNEYEQKALKKVVEIQGIPTRDKEILSDIAGGLASKLQRKPEEVKEVKRMPTKEGKPGILHIKLQNEELKKQWVNAAREISLHVADVVPGCDATMKKDKIFVRQAITPQAKNLLWKAKQELKETYKYIWCREGRVLLRKNDNAKVIVLRSESDIKNLSQS